MNIEQLILVVCSIAIILLGLTVYLRNPIDKQNQRFAVFSIFLLIWSVANFIADHSDSYALLFTRLTFLAGLLTIYSLLQFIAFFPSAGISKHSKELKLHRILTIILIPITLTPSFVESVEITDTQATITTAPLYYLFLFYIVLSLYLLAKILYKQHELATTSTKKQQVTLLSTGIILYALFALISNVVLPLLVSNWSASSYGPAFSMFLLGFVAYAIIKHKLFDVRLIVARSLAYILLVFALTSLYFGIIIVPSVYIIPDDKTFLRDIVPLIAALFVAGSAPFLKRFFDKQTNRFFYRDSYDPQLFLDTLNKALVGEIEIEKLLNGVSVIMENNLKSLYVAIGVKETGNRPLRILGANAPKYKPDDIMFVRSELVKMGQKTVLASNISSDRRKLQEVFRQNDIEIIVRLLTGYDTEEEAIAYLILGPKKSGNIYNKQDRAILGIIADELVIAIQNTLRFEEIQAFAVTLQEKVDEATAKLRRTNLKLKEMDETKDEFISMASHQLRTPLTSVKGYLSMVLDGDAGALKPQQKELLEQSFLSSQRMVYIIADLLNVSRLKTGKFVLDVNPTDLVNVVNGEIDQLHEAFRSKNLKITFTKPKDFPSLLLDETKIRQVIMNFIDNAVYYTPAGGNIWVELKQDKKHVYFTVKDSGLGVPKAEQSHLFGKFYRATNARKARPDGTGLGLFMAKRVVAAQGGSILFESTEGKGSTFGFCFETAKLLPKPDEKPDPSIK